mmetsp:Transcript_25783/g.56517  ORF Transcript_25783/g.56517 Transcript_25783/m.56517 type:complete len:209 (-) Transcript_25783:513-1139(-)
MNARLSHCGICIDWPLVWSSVGTFLTTPVDEKTWFKLAHRGLMVNGEETSSTECRLCDFHMESQLHLLSCPKLAPVQKFVSSVLEAMGTGLGLGLGLGLGPKLAPVQKFVSSVLEAMGTNLSEIHVELTWLLGIDTNGNILPSTHLALIRIYWRHVYAVMVRVKYDGDKFSLKQVKQSIARTFYSRVLAFQHERSLHFFRRPFSHHGN